jgi:hypothetical protein
MNHIYQGSHMIDRCIGKDSMAEVEDMTGSTFNPIEDSFHFPFNQIHWTE